MRLNKKKNIIIAVLCGFMVLMGVGYALLAQTLTINATASVSGSFDVQITNIEATTVHGYAIDTSDDSTKIANDGHSATISANLGAPGDYIVYTVTVSNLGTIAAMYDMATQNLITSPSGQSTDIIEATTDVDEVDSLKYLAPTTGVGTFIVTLTFKESVGTIPDDKNYQFTIRPNFVQTTLQNGGGVTPTPTATCEADEINLGGECFHIMSETNDSYTLLAKYNLLVGNRVTGMDLNEDSILEAIDSSTQGYGLQSSDAKGAVFTYNPSTEDFDLDFPWVGTIAFAYDTNNGYGYWTNRGTLLDSYKEKAENNDNDYPVYVYDSNSNLYSIVNNYETYLKGKGYSSVEARLMTVNEAESLGCDRSEHTCPTEGTNSWLTTTSYWLGSARDNLDVWFVFPFGVLDYNNFDNDECTGVRPVIEVLKSEVQNS